MIRTIAFALMLAGVAQCGTGGTDGTGGTGGTGGTTNNGLPGFGSSGFGPSLFETFANAVNLSPNGPQNTGQPSANACQPHPLNPTVYFCNTQERELPCVYELDRNSRCFQSLYTCPRTNIGSNCTSAPGINYARSECYAMQNAPGRCDGYSCGCIEDKCQCNEAEGFQLQVLNGTNIQFCLKVASLGELCYSFVQCRPGLRCANYSNDFGRCVDNCTEGSIYSTQVEGCIEFAYVPIGAACVAHAQCGAACSLCSNNGTCECPPGYEEHEGQCVENGGVRYAGSCNAPCRKCRTPGAVCTPVYPSFRCICPQGFAYDLDTDTCNEDVIADGNCTVTSQCAALDSYCHEGTCQCRNFHVMVPLGGDFYSCLQHAGHGMTCYRSEQCQTRDAQCIVDPNNVTRCLCQPGSYFLQPPSIQTYQDYYGYCSNDTSGVALGEDCEYNGQCLVAYGKAACINGTCLCANGFSYFLDKNGGISCRPFDQNKPPLYGDPCYNDDECIGGLLGNGRTTVPAGYGCSPDTFRCQCNDVQCLEELVPAGTSSPFGGCGSSSSNALVNLLIALLQGFGFQG